MGLGSLISLPLPIRTSVPEGLEAVPALEPEPEQEPGALGSLITRLFGSGWAPRPKDPARRRITGMSGRKPALEQTFAPHEQATLEDVRGGLGHIILGGLAPGSLPGITGRPVEVRAPGARPRPQTPIMRRPREAVGGASLGGLLQAQGAKSDIPDIAAGETYYSQLRRVIDKRHVQEKQSADDWLRYLRKPQRRVHEDELKFTGLGDLLRSKGRGRVTKTELREHLDANAIQVQELVRDDVTRGGERTKFSTYTLPGAENYREVLLRMPGADKPRLAVTQRGGKYGVLNADSREPFKINGREFWTDSVAKAEKVVASWNARENIGFRGGHWDEPNVLAHLRLSDRTTGGKRTLLVEEVQSDWAQKGRSEGFQKKTIPEDWKIRRLTTGEMEGFGVWDEANRQLIVRAPTEAEARRHALEYYNRELTGGGPGIPRAPFVEQTGKWTRLALKRVLKMAADEGYDRVGIVRGAEQAERYDLSKQVSRIRWDEQSGRLRADNLSGDEVISESNVTRSNLSDYIGKEAAERLIARKPNSKLLDVIQTERGAFDVVDEGGNFVDRFQTRHSAEKALKNRGNERELSGLDLRVGGEGMKAFYDVIVPEQLNKLAKEYGVKVQIEGGKVPTKSKGWVVDGYKEIGWHVYDENGNLVMGPRGDKGWKTKADAEAYRDKHEGNVPVHTLDVPEPMKERVKKKGFPLVSGTLRDLMMRTA